MAKRKKYELPSGTLRRQVYSHSEPLLDENGRIYWIRTEIRK